MLEHFALDDFQKYRMLKKTLEGQHLEDYFIKKGYQTNNISKALAINYEDSEVASRVFQADVYRLAQKMIIDSRAKRVLDIGCGIGYKLSLINKAVIRAGLDCHFIGIDGSMVNLEQCKNLGFGEWLHDDFDNPSLDAIEPVDLIVCADVIEHLFDPDSLLRYISKFTSVQTKVLISTPDRDEVRGAASFGPPPGQHIREWNKDEFARYLNSRGLKIVQHDLVNDQDRGALRNLLGTTRLDIPLNRLGLIGQRYKACQLVVATFPRVVSGA